MNHIAARSSGVKHAVRPNSRPPALANLDGRSKESRLMRDFRAELIRHVGGKPTATQAAMIDQAAQIKLRLAVMDRSFAEAGAVMTPHDSRTYLAWANSLGRLLSRLGAKAATPAGPSLAEYLSSRQTNTQSAGAAA